MRSPIALIVDDQEWTARALESILSPAGYAVVRAYTGKHGLERVKEEQPDLAFINLDLPDGSGVGMCRFLRDEPRLGASVPILVTGPRRPTRQQRLAAMEAGAWDVLTFPIDAQELVLKLNAYVRAKAETDRAKRESLIDRTTGLYSPLGITRRAAELSAMAKRREEPLACVVIAPLRSEEDGNRLAAAVQTLASAFREAGRTSDTIGRVTDTEFAVLAPDTDASGAAKLAERLRQAILSRQKGAQLPFQIKAGYDAVPNVSQTPADAQELLTHAGHALRKAMAAGSGEWILPFDRGAKH
ncbi:MAG: GGDEF domain-containing response regulator [Planctomycetota bacterium]|jgi:diguanylate cyclase (GGDEF)-like protein